ncbi:MULTISPECIES: hypothetical protein [Aquimarina]|uniref:hypothetical protein n=1 Tax=Aquimarina TaxID=290174 RepID=UPI0010500FEF|nr:MULTISPECIES: hypothetical protein [Aquimarina]
MKLINLLLVVFSITNLSCKLQTQMSRIEIVQPTVEQEVISIWRTINDFSFLEKQGYTINLPKKPLIDSLIIKSKNGTFGNEDFSTIYNLVETEIFNHEDYEKAIQKVKNQHDLINKLVYEIDSTKNQWDWDFNTFDKYKITFTLYGTGGSYDPENGTITLLTNKEGSFMNYKNPANTIIHEITHMGMEYSIVQKYKLSHGNKERIVDKFVYLMFNDKLPEYRVQDMGNTKIDDYLNKQEHLNTLSSIISKFVD